MRRRLFVFLLILSVLIGYTTFKSLELWPRFGLFLPAPIFLFMLGPTLLYRNHPNVFAQTWFLIFSWLGSVLMGLWATFVALSLPIDCVRAVAWGLHGDGRDLSLAVLGVSLALSFLGLLIALRGPMVKRVVIPLSLRPELSTLKIVQMSDLHIGITIGKRFVNKVVRAVNALSPDFVFFTGDLADAKAGSIRESLHTLSALKPRYGAFYVTGNHEYYSDVEGLVSAMREVGFQPLLNENRIVAVGDARVLIAGVTDPAGQMFPGHSPDLKQAASSQQDVDLKILLAHRPGVVDEAEKLGFNLQFSGHTHSGQFFPFNLLIGLFHKYWRDLNRHGQLWLYVNRGTGFWGPANRFAVTSEISFIEFKGLSPGNNLRGDV